MVKPKASSTPKFVDICRRPPIGSVNNDTLQSPISNYTHKYDDTSENEQVESNSEGEYVDYVVDSADETDNEERICKNTTFCNCIKPSCLGIVTVTLLFAAILYGYTEEQYKIHAASAEILSQEFPTQTEDFWLYIKQGIGDIKVFHKPRTFIFLYNDESQETLEKMLIKISEFATCTITNCTALPVILEADDLRAPDILKDYGEIISRNKEKLEESGVMVIRNLEKVPGTSAQAFHSFCDEFNPIVKEALFIFTMKVDNPQEFGINSVEQHLHNYWKDIKNDKFHALFTRIADVVLPITAEKYIG